MIFALAAALLTALAVAAVLIPVLRRHRQAPSRADYDLTVYRDQLGELESDRARGLVSEEQVEAARTEIERRMLRAARAREAAQAEEAAQASAPGGRAAWRRRAAAIGLGLCIPALAAGVYASLGTPGLPGRPFAEIERPPDPAAADAAFSEPVERLAARLGRIRTISRAGFCSAAPMWFCSATLRRPTRCGRRPRFPAAQHFDRRRARGGRRDGIAALGARDIVYRCWPQTCTEPDRAPTRNASPERGFRAPPAPCRHLRGSFSDS